MKNWAWMTWAAVAVNSAMAAEAWREPAFPARVRFDVPSDAAATVVVDVETPQDWGAGLRAYAPSGAAVAARRIRGPGNRLQAVVAVHDGERIGYSLYVGDSSVEGALEPAINMPVRVESFLLAGNSAPADVERFQFMLNRAGAPRGVVHRETFGDLVGAVPPQERDSHSHRTLLLHRVTGYAVFSQAGAYRFGLDVSHGGVLLINGIPVVEDFCERRIEGTRVSAALDLSEGLHRLDVLTCAPQSFRAIPSWAPEGAAELARIAPPSIVAGALATNARLDVRDAVVNAHFTATILDAVRFRNDAREFVRVRFENLTEAAEPENVSYLWTMSDGFRSTDKHLERLFTTRGRHEIVLTATASGGAAVECRRRLDLSAVASVGADYRLKAFPTPPVMAPDDAVRLSLRAWRESGPTLAGMDVAWTIVRGDGTTETGVSVDPPPRMPWQVYLPEMRAGAPREIRWALRYRGADIETGALRFIAAADMPADVRWQAGLIDARGIGYVVVPSLEPERNRRREAGAGWLALSDSLLASAPAAARDAMAERLNAGPGGYRGPLQVVNVMEGPGARFGGSLLAGVPLILRALDDDTEGRAIVLALGQDALLAGADGRSIELEALALSDLIAARTGSHPLWLVPPRVDGHASRSRELAGALMRAADRRGVAAADLYSAGLTSDAGPLRMPGQLALSRHGGLLAGELLARVLGGRP